MPNERVSGVIKITGSPVSVNEMYLRGKGSRLYMSAKGRDWKERVAAEAFVQWKVEQKLPVIQTKCGLTVEVCFADKRRRDISNILKAIEDAMIGIVLKDDSLIDRIFVVRRYGCAKANVVLTIETL